MSIKIGIYGYGNLAKGVELAVKANPDMELAAVFTRRDPSTVKIATEGAVVASASDIESYKDKIDVMIICGGSATDLPEQTPAIAKLFNCVDSFDTHAKVPEHFANVDAAAKSGSNTALISCGWDPGMFSLARLYGNCILPDGKDYTFWGKGVSQGHSDAIRRIPGVKNGKQYTIPVEAALEAVRSGSNPELTTRQTIKEMPNYFSDYDTTVHFISEEEFKANHSGMNHGGFVFRTGTTGSNKHVIEYSLKLDSNPEFTGSVLTAYARAIYRLSQKGDFGCKSVFDIAPALLSPMSGEELRAHLL